MKSGKSNLLLLIGALVSCLSFGWAEAPLIVRYELDLVFKPGNGGQLTKIEGVNRVWIKNNWNQSLGELHFHNSANGFNNQDLAGGPKTLIGNIRSSQLEKITSSAGISMRVGLFPALNPGEEVVLEIPFTTAITALPGSNFATVGNKSDTVIYNLLQFYPVLEFFHSDGWHQQDHYITGEPYHNFSDYNVSITLPRDYGIGTSAPLTRIDTLTSTLIRLRYQNSQAREFSALISKQLIQRTVNISGLAVNFYYTSGESANVEKVIDLIGELITFYESRFGPIPNNHLTIGMGYALDASVIGRSNFILFQDGYQTAAKRLPRLVARQWFGTVLNPDILYEKRLIESFAEYAAYLYRVSKPQSERKSYFESVKAVLEMWQNIDELPREEIMRRLYNLFGRTIVPPVYEPQRQTNWESSVESYSNYAAGFHALQMLETAVGDSLMGRIIQTYISKNSWKSVNTETFIETVSRLVDKQMGDNFRLALTTNLRPDYMIKSVTSSGRKDRRWDVEINTRTSGMLMLPVDLEIITASDDTIYFYNLQFGASDKINLTTDSPVTKVMLDPSKRTFDANRFNNRWPRTYLMQPIYGLPSWEVYKLYYRPVLREDWRRNWRTGVHLSGGMGLNLMPLLPAFYQNAFELVVNFNLEQSVRQVGLKFTYRTPLNSIDHTFWEMKTSWEYPRNEQALSLSRYIGPIKYLIANRQSAYQRLTGQIKRTEFANTDPDNRWNQGKLFSLQVDFIRFRYNPRQRSNMQFAFMAGQAFQKKTDAFARLSGLVDFESRILDKLIVRTHGEFGLVWDERTSNYLRYRLQHQLRAWRPRTEFVPLYRGFTPVKDEYWNSVIGSGFSVGVITEWPVWPMVYIDGALAEQSGGSPEERWSAITDNPIYASAGIGIESQSLVELGLYLPLWISHPIGSGTRWGWRWLVQWGFYF